ncbi:hypothetical protein Tco_0875004 [Tanacetum coccineum]|uniref:Uncharacterized protein n=1 Tax=Tanacetum coccineum TaxID=301880 RepID=A0ABQ5BP16_9ASTR
MGHGRSGSGLQDVNFSLLADLKSNKDASVETVMNILRLEDPLAEKLGLSDLQPHVDQLMIKENIANHRSALCDVFVPLAKPLFVMALTCMEGTSNVIPATTDTTTALSLTFSSTNIIAPISVYDYEVVGTDSQADADGNAEPFPNVDDAELNILQSRLILRASLFCAKSTSAVLSVGIPISAGMIASVLLAFISSPKLRFALSTSPLVCECLTEAKCWRIHNNVIPHEFFDLIASDGCDWFVKLDSLGTPLLVPLHLYA